jgi:hypothetical protein
MNASRYTATRACPSRASGCLFFKHRLNGRCGDRNAAERARLDGRDSIPKEPNQLRGWRTLGRGRTREKWFLLTLLCRWAPTAESLMIAWEHLGVPPTLKSLFSLGCDSPPLGTNPLSPPEREITVRSNSCMRPRGLLATGLYANLSGDFLPPPCWGMPSMRESDVGF